jgi:hypothetical protein
VKEDVAFLEPYFGNRPQQGVEFIGFQASEEVMLAQALEFSRCPIVYGPFRHISVPRQ